MSNPASLDRLGYLISAPWRSSGKTIITIGLAAAARQRQIAIQTFKKGPDFIDPLWMGIASGQPCYNLDPHQQSLSEITALYSNQSANAQLTLIEGTMGLHDGLELDGSDSNAAIAKLLQVPVVLVMDSRGMHRTAAALINGVQQFDKDVEYAGVVLNRVRTSRHGSKIQQALHAFTDLKVIGEIPEVLGVAIDEKNLGLVPAPDHQGGRHVVETACQLVNENCDVQTLFASALAQADSACQNNATVPAHNEAVNLRIGIAKDEAFHFYYQDDIDQLRSSGVELVEVSPLRDTLPDELDAFIIGGGFPERHAQALSENTAFLSDLSARIGAGLPVHAECAGLMYLCKTLTTEVGESWSMAGVINADVTMHKKPVGRGYMQLTTLGSENEPFWVHEFHHSEIAFDSSPEFVYRVHRGHGINGQYDGVKIHNVIASYAHFRHTQATPWIDWFLSRVRQHRLNRDDQSH